VYHTGIHSVVLDVPVTDAGNLAKPTAPGTERFQREETAQQVGHFLRPRVRDSKTGDTESDVWGETPPKIGDVDGDKRWPEWQPGEA
jgi:hypothetical protein